MSILKKLENWPSPEKTRIIAIFGIILMFIIYPIMAILFTQSGGPMDILGSQLSFSGTKMKGEYLQIVIHSGVNIYRLAQILDYVFMFSYGSLIFSLALIIGRKFDAASRWRQLGYIIAILGIAAACLDAMENLFILLTLTDPLFFPDWWTVAHSCFSLPKWILIMTCIVWAILAALIHKFGSRK